MNNTYYLGIKGSLCALLLLLCSGCAYLPDFQQADSTTPIADDSVAVSEEYDYLIGPGDILQIFVWRNPEVSLEQIAVRPDGKITTPLVEDLVASGKTPSQLARDIEQALATYIRQPIVTVIVNDFTGTPNQQIRVIGEATDPKILPYSRGVNLLDVMINVGGLTEFAAGNRAFIIRKAPGGEQKIPVRIEDLLEEGDINANVLMRPGDVLIIPEAWL